MARLKRKRTGLIAVPPGKKVRLHSLDSADTGDYKNEADAAERLAHLEHRLFTLQEKLYAEHERSLLVIFQSMDTGGKDGAVKHILSGINPAGVHITNFKAPSSEELDHDFLWRAHQRVPAKGMIGVWNRSHYEDVLAVRVHNLVPEKVWKGRYDDINDFEELLTENGVAILKFYLFISKDEQKHRLQARLDDPTKHWKFNPSDLKERMFWDEYEKAFEAALSKCSTKDAPWMIVPADHKWARNIAIAEAIVERLDEMDPKYPSVSFNPAGIVIE